MTNNCAMVKLRTVLFRQFDIKEGVRQGDPLACLLFNICLEKLIRDAEVETRNTIFNKSVQILAYADDIVINVLSLALVKEIFISKEKTAKEMGLRVNENKIKFMALNDPAYSNLMCNRIFMIESYNFEVVTEFIYLEEEIKRSIKIGNRCYYGLSKLMKSELLKRKTKCHLHKTIKLPTVLYGSESWSLSKAHRALLGGSERKI
jgi:sorting nexin-29